MMAKKKRESKERSKDMTTAEDIKYTLKELRARKNVTQMQVAKDLGISTQTYNAWERDISNVSVSKVLALAKYYGVTISQIFLG